ncbi:MAG: response regulator transcription factor [Acidimicrobiales bacterium]
MLGRGFSHRFLVVCSNGSHAAGGTWSGDRAIDNVMSQFRVMVVEDDEALRAALARALRLEGYAVEEASDGARALSQLASLRADVVVLDVMMPEVDGLTVCQRLRGAGDRTPVLLLTARDLVADRVQGLKAGADDYLTKPFAVDELLARRGATTRPFRSSFRQCHRPCGAPPTACTRRSATSSTTPPSGPSRPPPSR